MSHNKVYGLNNSVYIPTVMKMYICVALGSLLEEALMFPTPEITCLQLLSLRRGWDKS